MNHHNSQQQQQQQGNNVPYFPPPPPPLPPNRPIIGAPPPLPPRIPSDPGYAQQHHQLRPSPPALPPRATSGSLRNWGSSLAKNVSSNIKTLAREGAQAASSSPYFKQLTGAGGGQQMQAQQQQQAGYYYQHPTPGHPQQHRYDPQQPQYLHPQSPPVPQPYQQVNSYQTPPTPQTYSPAGQQQAQAAPSHGTPHNTHVMSGQIDAVQPSSPAPAGTLDEHAHDPRPQMWPGEAQATPASPRITQYQYLGPSEAIADDPVAPHIPEGRFPSASVTRKEVPSPNHSLSQVSNTGQVHELDHPPVAPLPHRVPGSVNPPPETVRIPDGAHHQLQERVQSAPVERYTLPIEPRDSHLGIEPRDSHLGIEPRDQYLSPASYPAHSDSSTEQQYPDHNSQQQANPSDQSHSYPFMTTSYTTQATPDQHARPPPPPPRETPSSPEQIISNPPPSNIASVTTEAPRSDASVSGLIDNVMSSFQNLNVNNTGHSQAQRDLKWIEDDWARPPLSFNPDGRPNEIVWDCPSFAGDSPYKASWYHLPQVPDFLICTRCYDRFLARTNLSLAFDKVQPSISRCRFNVPRITMSLLPQCRATGDVLPLEHYFKRRLSINDCKGINGTTGKDGIKWFAIERETNEICSFLVSCEACYEDVLLASPAFSGEFVPRDQRYPDRPQGEKDVWICDMSFNFVERSYCIYSRNGVPFMDWVTQATHRFRLPKCEGKPVESSSCRWLRPKDTVESMVICEECYFDQIAWTAIAADFEYVDVPKPVSNSERMDYILGHRSEPATAWVCDLKNDAIISALESSIKRQDARIFSNAARTILSSPACTAEGIPNGKWYTLKGGAEEFDVCAAHYAGFFEAWGQDRFLEPAKSSGSEQAYLCNLNPNTGRYLQFMRKLYEAGQEGVWSRYEDTVRKYAAIPECPRDAQVPNRRWYGWLDCPMCHDCFEAVTAGDEAVEGVVEDRAVGGSTRQPLAGTAIDGFVQKMELHNDLIQENRMCCMHSPRMRQKYAEARSLNDAAALLEFSRQRYAVYARTIPRVKMIRSMQNMQMQMAMTAGMASLMYNGAEGISVVAGNTDGYLHGNSELGWHQTENGVESARLFNKMNAGYAAAASSGPWMEIFQLTMEWEQWQ